MMESLFLIYAISWVIYAVFFAWACGYVADSKGKDKGAWIVLGLFFGVFALLVIGLTAKNSKAVYQGNSKAVYQGNNEELRKCPSCAETIKLEATKCRYCGEIFNPEEVKNEISVFRQKQLGKIEKEKEIAKELEEKQKKEEKEFKKKLAVSYMCNECSYMIHKNDLKGNLFCPECGGLLTAG